MAKKWIKAATANSHGQFKAKAEAAGKTTKEYAAEHYNDSGTLGKEARLASNLMGLHHGSEKKKTRSASETRHKLYGSKE